MTKKEAYKILYTFLKKNGVFAQYCSNIVKAKPFLEGKNGKEILECIIDRYVGGRDYMLLDFLFPNGESTFWWRDSYEGLGYWAEVNSKWLNFIKDKELSSLYIK